ncbi:hypothetical protein KY321_02900 [Candidatus Woesearchaeota archaeon]|nr:hypothetical protein [Candidatus Woesearchaeota archaeon]
MKQVPLAVIEEYFKDVEFTDDHIELDQCTTITNIKKFYESHLSILKANSGKKNVMPYYKRLLKLYYFYKSH